MANNESLKDAIAAVVKENQNNEITGNLMQQSLFAIINQLGNGAVLMGVATPETNPGLHDNRVFYIATEIGDYVNFDGIKIENNGFGFLVKEDVWKLLFMPVDGKGIASIELTNSVGNVDVYTITYTDQTTSIFTVTNGTNAQSFIFKGNANNYAEITGKTGSIQNDAWYNLADNLLYVYNGVDYPVEGTGIDFRVGNFTAKGNNATITIDSAYITISAQTEAANILVTSSYNDDVWIYATGDASIDDMISPGIPYQIITEVYRGSFILGIGTNNTYYKIDFINDVEIDSSFLIATPIL